jgi:hypothetical protein
MEDQLEIINPDVISTFCDATWSNNLVQCNKSDRVSLFIQTGKYYLMKLPEINTTLNLKCTYAAVHAADMEIQTAYVNGELDAASTGCTISYVYKNFDSICYTSFVSREKCKLYICVEDMF